MALPEPVQEEEAEEAAAAGGPAGLIGRKAQAQRIAAHPPHRRPDRPQGEAEHHEAEQRMKEERLREIAGREVAGAARTSAPEARPPSPPHEQATRQLPAGLEPGPAGARQAEERQRPDELVIELPGKGGTTDEAQHRSGAEEGDEPAETATREAAGEEVEHQLAGKDRPTIDADRRADRAASQD